MIQIDMANNSCDDYIMSCPKHYWSLWLKQQTELKIYGKEIWQNSIVKQIIKNLL